MAYMENLWRWPKGTRSSRIHSKGEFGEGGLRIKSGINGKWCDLTPEEMKIIASLKEDLARQKDEHTMLLKEKENLLMSVDQSLKIPQLDISTKGDSSLKKRLYEQPSSLSCHACEKLRHISTMCMIKDSFVNGACRWVPKEKMDECIQEAKRKSQHQGSRKRVEGLSINKSKETWKKGGLHAKE